MNLDRHNFVQFLCARPELFTPHSTVAEVLAVVTGFEAGNCLASDDRRDRSAKLVWRWLVETYGNPPDGTGIGEYIAKSLLNEHETDDSAIAAIGEFASTLPPAPERQ